MMCGTGHMSRARLSVIFMALVLVAQLSPSAWAGKWLVTPEEAAKAGERAAGWKELAAAVEGAGPIIIVHDPRALNRVQAPLNILVSFEPGKSGERPDMASLTVTLIGFFDIDITDRIREHIIGDTLKVEDANLPEGSHRLRLAIKDIGGNPNERDMVVNVVE
jgi:hypothetical protein